ncbi:LLM class flavin-dependent oxidoreductase [Sinirhodobacter populi]|uniref:LLM class flavin-dependent oxidoreductase n=1 Tax=Paenirhodobacter populi TaxID=2306993 RepID=A0A443K4N3_9RHOB|nr:LLM class flavin-dependent oxidoreductase [Sinirhodobacter populi]RWR27710.1 LLM class flavin-dependent oxidoreductase [Sinirhodobacter populi]
MTQKHMHFGLFHLPVGRHPYGWRLPTAEGHPEDLAWAVRVARKAEEGLFDAFFMADSLVGPVRGEQGRPGGFEPLTLAGAIAATTSRVGIVATVSTSFSEPFNVARMLASLDHMSGGRAGWNVVTSQSDRAAQNFGQNHLEAHAERYERATEYLDVVTALWDSWQAGAMAFDKGAGIMVDYDKVHEIAHEGRFYNVRGPLNISRPPQGHPVIFQAGSSGDGLKLAGSRADVAFTAQDEIDEALNYKHALHAAAAGRADGWRPLVMPGIMPITARTGAEAREKFRFLQENTDIAAGIRQLSGRWGYDLSGYDPEGPVPDPSDRVHGESRVRMLLQKVREENYRLRDLAALAIASHGHRILIGSPTEVADELQRWFEAGAADGFNIIPASMPDGIDDFVELVVPELQTRGLYRTAYEGRTLRDHLGLPSL